MKSNGYSKFDHPHVTQFLFHPRPDTKVASVTGQDLYIPIENEIQIHARAHLSQKNFKTILFFHGNGEIVSDYDELSHLFEEHKLNFIVFDYRGYGKSTGSPSVSTMINDSHIIFKWIKKWLIENGYKDQLIIMGRSLGSACALEIAASYETEIKGLIIESGFAHAIPLLKLIGVDTDSLQITDDKIGNISKIKKFHLPTLIIHALHDHIIPYSDAEDLLSESNASQKNLVCIKGADHNSIFFVGMKEYLTSIQNFSQELT